MMICGCPTLSRAVHLRGLRPLWRCRAAGFHLEQADAQYDGLSLVYWSRKFSQPKFIEATSLKSA
jgi:hypothetical protein